MRTALLALLCGLPTRSALSIEALNQGSDNYEVKWGGDPSHVYEMRVLSGGETIYKTNVEALQAGSLTESKIPLDQLKQCIGKACKLEILEQQMLKSVEFKTYEHTDLTKPVELTIPEDEIEGLPKEGYLILSEVGNESEVVKRYLGQVKSSDFPLEEFDLQPFDAHMIGPCAQCVISYVGIDKSGDSSSNSKWPVKADGKLHLKSLEVPESNVTQGKIHPPHFDRGQGHPLEVHWFNKSEAKIPSTQETLMYCVDKANAYPRYASPVVQWKKEEMKFLGKTVADAFKNWDCYLAVEGVNMVKIEDGDHESHSGEIY